MQKSKLFTLLVLALAVCTIFGMMVFSVSGEEADHPHTESTTHCVCGGSNAFCTEDHSTTAVTWSAWTGTETDGYYYLTGDITVSTELKIASGANLYLCLNGYTITVDGVRLFQLAGTNRSLNICDCSENQTGTITTNNTKASGTLILASYGTVNLYGGNYINNAESTVYGFIRAGGTSSTTTYSGEINMYGGKIQGNTMKQGGSVFIVKNCTFNMYGGQIVGGHTTSTGGNVYCAGTFNMSGGSISGGVSDSGNSGNMYITADGTLKMTGGSIAGYVVNAGKVSVGKAAVINETGLYFTGAGSIVLNAGMSDGSLIRLAANTKELTIPTTNYLNADNFEAPAGKAFSFDPDAETKALVLVDAHEHCLCGQQTHTGDCNGDVVTYNIWQGTATVPTAGNWCLEKDLDQASLTMSANLNLCLNGYTWDAGAENRALYNGAAYRTLNLTDCGENGTITGSYGKNQGKLLYFMNGAVNLYGGNYINTEDATRKNGGAISLGYKSGDKTYAATLNAYGVTITGTLAQDGGVIHLSNGSQANIYDSVLNTGDSYRGAINVLAGCSLNIQDSTINGFENKTGIWNCGTMTVSGNVAFTNCAPNIMIDYRDGNQPTLDVSGLNVTTPITLRRYEVDNVNDDAGLLAQNATESHLAMLAAYKPGYYLSLAEGNIYLNDCAVQSFAGTDIVGGGATLDEALAQENAAIWYVLNTDLSEQTVSKNTIIDLNGHDLSALTIAEGVAIVLLDTTTSDFDCSDGYGVVTLSENSKGTIATNAKTATADVGFVQHYVVIPAEDGSYSSHRFYAFITSVSLKPVNAALGYKATFQGDEVVRSAVTGFGYNMWVNDGAVKNFVKEGSFNNKQVVTLRLQNIMVEGSNAISQAGATATINGNAFVTFNLNGQPLTIEGTTNTTTLKTVIEAVDGAVADYDDVQMTAVQTMVNKFASYMDGWAITNITGWTPATDET